MGANRFVTCGAVLHLDRLAVVMTASFSLLGMGSSSLRDSHGYFTKCFSTLRN